VEKCLRGALVLLLLHVCVCAHARKSGAHIRNGSETKLDAVGGGNIAIIVNLFGAIKFCVCVSAEAVSLING
jgi:hypothetical protein